MSSKQPSRDSWLGYAVLAALILAAIAQEIYEMSLNQLLQTGLLIVLVVLSYRVLIVLEDIERKL